MSFSSLRRSTGSNSLKDISRDTTVPINWRSYKKISKFTSYNNGLYIDDEVFF
jgi:hypothetical protein